MAKSAAETHRDKLHEVMFIGENTALARLCISMFAVGLILLPLAVTGRGEATLADNSSMLPHYTANHFYAQVAVILVMFGLVLSRKHHPLLIVGLTAPCILLSGIALYDSFRTLVQCFFFNQCHDSPVDVLVFPPIVLLLASQIIGLNAYMEAHGAQQQVTRLQQI